MALPMGEVKVTTTMLKSDQTPACPICELTIDNRRGTSHRDLHTNVAFLSLSGLFLMTPFAQMSIVILLLLGCYLILRGITTRTCKRLVPGGLLSGIGLGFVLTSGPLHLVSGDIAGSLFLLACALGMFSISILSKRFTRHPQWWPLLPGGMLALTSLFMLI